MQQKKRGRPPKEEKKENVGLRIDPKAWEMLDHKAKSLGISRAALIERIALSGAEAAILGESSAS